MATERTGLKKVFDYHIPKNAVNNYLLRHAGGEQRPVFHDIDATCPQLNELTAGFQSVRAELDGVLHAGGELPRYHDVDPGEAEISAVGDPDSRWNVYLLHLLGAWPSRARRECPRTCRLLEGIPNLVQAFFSILDPRKSVPPHDGPYLGYLRYHLGLRIPTDDPPKIRVAGQDYTWKEGQGVLFDDSWTHEVINHSDQPRAVLVVDILRPLPTAPHLLNRFMTNVAARYTYGRAVIRRAERFGAGADVKPLAQ